jgi:methionyl-tRNA synthetase
MKAEITFQDFIDASDKIDIRVGQIIEAERVPETDKLLKLTVNFGGDIGHKTSVTNVGEFFTPDDVIGIKLPFVMNLKPSKMRGILSDVMIVAGTTPNGLTVDYIKTGTEVGTKLL